MTSLHTVGALSRRLGLCSPDDITVKVRWNTACAGMARPNPEGEFKRVSTERPVHGGRRPRGRSAGGCAANQRISLTHDGTGRALRRGRTKALEDRLKCCRPGRVGSEYVSSSTTRTRIESQGNCGQ